MSKEKIKVYLYTRVSTTMQIDGYSLDAQKTKMKAFCDYMEFGEGLFLFCMNALLGRKKLDSEIRIIL